MEKITIDSNWYGVRLKLPDHVVKKIIENSDIADVIMTAGGATIVATGGLTAPIMALIIAFIKLQLLLIKRLNKGKGVYIVKPWIGNIIFPLPIK